MKSILITGALGHIGSGFIHSLRLGDFERVVLVDNFFTQRYSSLFNLPEKVKFEFIEADIMKTDLINLFRGIDIIIHLAAITNAEGSFDIQDKVEQVNYDGTKRVAEACIEAGSKLIFISTTSVYGTQESIVNEACSESELQPQSPYAKSKLQAEKLLEELGRTHNLEFITCRFGTIYGVSIGMRFHTAVNKFVWQACCGHSITVWKTALHQKRPYLSLFDAIRALNFIITNNIFDREVYNVLTDNMTVDEISRTIKKFVSGLEVSYVDSRIMNQLSYTVSCDKFKSLGFEFKGQLSTDIKETVQLLSNIRSR